MSTDASLTASSVPPSLPAVRFRPRLTYAIAPPNRATSAERRRAIAVAQSARIAALPIDALLVYDVQDEAARNGAPRPFAFAPKVDPLGYAYDELALGALPRVVYRAVSGHDERSLRGFFERLRRVDGHAVLVGAPSRLGHSSFSLPAAYSIGGAHAPQVSLGGVVIAERHRANGAEDARVLSKMRQGCRFFVSQTVWSVAATRQLLRDLRQRAEIERSALPPLLLTFSPCGSSQTLDFLAWLGVELPDAVRRDLLSASDMLARSVELAYRTFAEVRDFAEKLGLFVGCNVESVSSRSAEVDASLELVQRIARLT